MKKIQVFFVCAVSLGLFSIHLHAQSSLVLSSGSGAPGATVPLNLTLTSTSGNMPAAVQWSLGHSTGVASMSVVPGPSLTAASKGITCGTNVSGLICIAVGNNANAIADGVVATVNVTLAANATSAGITVGNSMGASANGLNIAASGTGAIVQVVQTVTISSLSCIPSVLATSASTSCTVTLSGAAPTGGTAVSLSGGSPNVSVPASVTVASGSTSASFTANTGSFTGSAGVTLTATLGTSSVSTGLTATAGPVSLACSPSTISAGQSGNCTVSMAGPGSVAKTVTLQSGSAGLTVPASVTVPAGSASATFAFSTAASLSGAATVTASAEGGSRSTTITAQNSAPTVSILSPANGASLSGSATVTANASNSVSVQFTLDGANLGAAVSGSGPSYSTTWDTTTAANGSHTLAAVASNGAGNQVTASVSVTVNNSLVITNVTAGGITSSGATITWSTSQPSNSQVVYGPTSIYGSTSGINSAMVTSHSVTLSGLTASTTYHYQVQSTNALGTSANSTDFTFTTSGSQQTGTLLQLQMNSGEVSGTKNGSVVTPTIGPSGFTGAIVVNGSGSVNFAPGNGAYFLNCCANTNNAFYRFTGSTVGNIFNLSQGQVSFNLTSRYSFAQRQASAASPRLVFAVQDANANTHLIYFLTEYISGYLTFSYATGGGTQFYYVAHGTEDALFGSGVTLQVAISWNGTKSNLYLNGKLVQTATYTPATPNWTSASRFDLGSMENQPYGGYNSCDDIVSAFAVTGPSGADTTPPVVTMTAPAIGMTVLGDSVTISATATDNVAVASVQFQLDGTNLGNALTSAGPSYSATWDSTKVLNGSHTLSALATDTSGNSATASVTVTVNNPIVLPVISGVTAGSITSSGATINWSTDQASTSQVAYGTTTAYGTRSSLQAGLVTTHSVVLAGLSPATTYHYQVLSANWQGAQASSADYTFTTVTGPLLQITGNAAEVSGASNGSVVTPTIAPSGFTGTVVSTGSGSVNFAPGNGVYFLNCCANTNNAFYRFTGSTVGNIFNLSQGQVSFNLTSRYSFAQRQASAASPRMVFAVQDANTNTHLIYFLTEYISGYLAFSYATGGGTQFFYVAHGTEDALFGSGVTLQVTISWNGTSSNLYLNGKLVQTAAYNPVTPNWTSASRFDLGATENQPYGGYNSCDDIVSAFAVSGTMTGVTSQTKSQGLTPIVTGRANRPASVVATASSPSRPISLYCSPNDVTGDQNVVCELRLDRAASGGSTAILLSTDNSRVRVPPSVEARSGQTAIRFQPELSAAGSQTTAVISAQGGGSAVQTNLIISRPMKSELTVPNPQTVRPGSMLQFKVIAVNSDGMPITASAANLPAGSRFDPQSGTFQWEPTESDLGEHRIAFSAATGADDSVTRTVSVYVDSGKPMIEKLENGANEAAAAACSPGSVGVLRGRSLYTDETPAADYSGASAELHGTRVLVNDASVPVLYGSPEAVSFLCPAGLPAGSPMRIAVETDAGRSNTLTSEMAESAPGIFAVDDRIGRKARAVSESGELSQIPTPETAGLPILPQSNLVLLTTGVPCNSSSIGRLLVKVEQQYVVIESIRSATHYAGACEISIDTPDISGDSLALELESLGSDGRSTISNVATASIAKR